MLWGFAQSLHSNSLQVNTDDRTLICDCTDELIEDAIANYNARLVLIHDPV